MESFISSALKASSFAAVNASAANNIGDVWHQPRELSLSCWHEVVHCYMNAAKEKYSIEKNNSLIFIHKGQTIMQQLMIPLWASHRSTIETDKAEACIQSIISTYRYVLQRPKYRHDVQQISNLKANPLKLSIQQRILNNNPVTYKEQQIRDRIFESAESFYQYMNRQYLKDVSYSEYIII
jgi:hypothetical protein